jgi:hypothetical protein
MTLMPDDNEHDNLQAMFAEMRETTTWDVDGELLWSYFFTDPVAATLLAAGSELGKLGFTVVGVDEAEFEDEHVHGEHCAHDHDRDERGTRPAAHVHDEHCGHNHAEVGPNSNEGIFYVLQVDEVRRHTADSLHARHIELRAFAAAHKLDAFDGIEVGEAHVQAPAAATLQ